MTYPKVLSEAETLELALREYRGFTRYGDGDFAVLRGQRDRYQKWDPALARKLAQSLAEPSEHVLNCIIPTPRFTARLQHHHWLLYLEANAGIIPFLRAPVYGSANISRMDSAPDLHSEEWWVSVARLWLNLRVTLVRGSERSLTEKMLMESPSAPMSVTEVITKSQNSWDEFDEIYDRVGKAGNRVVLLCNGLVTRPLVHRLCDAGMYAYDLGHFGVWFDKGQPKATELCRP